MDKEYENMTELEKTASDIKKNLEETEKNIKSANRRMTAVYILNALNILIVIIANLDKIVALIQNLFK